MKVACIGSRKWGPNTLQGQMLIRMGEVLARRGDTVVSGNASGADQCFALGATSVDPKLVELHLPWATYEIDAIHSGNIVHSEPSQGDVQSAGMAYDTYRGAGNFIKLGQGVQKLMARNWGIVQASARMVAAPSLLDGQPTGGTAFGIWLHKRIRANSPCLVRFDIPYDDQGPAWDLCRDCGFKSGFWDCGATFHSLKAYV